MMPTVLVANRGEIAARILRSAHALGLGTVAVFTDADADAPHVALADAAVHLPGDGLAETYLSAEALLEAAARTGATLVHPGYGFLSENAAFARAVGDAGLTWVGPPPDAIAAMGDKSAAKARMRAAGVPCVPGLEGDVAALQAGAAALGLPLLVKASAGGGGRGLRRVEALSELPSALERAASEATSAFGDSTVLLERFVERGRHVEVQVLADAHGHVLHLGERDCSVQRRHQKVIEEAPAVDAELRTRMGEAAVKAARAVDYVGAGTVEFLLDDGGDFFFLEMNTRLQVEHPVTELITGLDLVDWQLRIALGQPLTFTQAEVQLDGHAIEARLYAEAPELNWAPRTGTVLAWVPSEGVRIDHGLREGLRVTARYDPMLAKIIAHGPDRETARRRLLRALARTTLLGVSTNRRALLAMLDHKDFAAGAVHTNWLSEHYEEVAGPGEVSVGARFAALSGWVRQTIGRGGGPRSWGVGSSVVRARFNDESFEAHFSRSGSQERWRSGDAEGRVQWVRDDGTHWRVRIDGIERSVVLADDGHGGTWIDVAGHALHVRPPAPRGVAAMTDSGLLRAPSAGTVVAVEVREGDAFTGGEVLIVLEAMKLETPLSAPGPGVVAEVRVRAGEVVQARDVLVVWEEAS